MNPRGATSIRSGKLDELAPLPGMWIIFYLHAPGVAVHSFYSSELEALRAFSTLKERSGYTYFVARVLPGENLEELLFQAALARLGDSGRGGLLEVEW